jgi:hypothetical protein
MSEPHTEVWNHFTQTWAGDFEVVEETEKGYWLRRCSDGALLPSTIAKDAVRQSNR